MLARLMAHAWEHGHREAVIAAKRATCAPPVMKEVARDVASCDPKESGTGDQEASATGGQEASAIGGQGSSCCDLDGQGMLRGRVPQIADWVDAWAEGTEMVAFRKQQRLNTKRTSRRDSNLRRIRRRQVSIMAEVRREQIRLDLRAAYAISLAMDDRKKYKIVRYRCDAPRKPYVRHGVLGVLCLDNSVIDEFEEDHALVALRKLDGFIERVCTPGPGCRPLATDFALKEHILKNTRVFAADGASKERRALFLAVKEVFKNVVLVIRDPAHVLRISVKKPIALR